MQMVVLLGEPNVRDPHQEEILIQIVFSPKPRGQIQMGQRGNLVEENGQQTLPWSQKLWLNRALPQSDPK